MGIFEILAEVSVAIAGFSSLAIVFRGSSTTWSGQNYVSLAFGMCWSIGSVFLALLPLVLDTFGLELQKSAQIGLFTTVVYMLSVGGYLTYVRKRIATGGGGSIQLSLGLSILFGLIVTGALAAGFGWLPGPNHGWYAATIMLLMAHATAELGQLVITIIRQSD